MRYAAVNHCAIPGCAGATITTTPPTGGLPWSRCYLLLRIAAPDGVMAQAAQHVWGQPYDSPNIQVAYNALLQLGIFASVLVEDSGLWRPWTNASLDEALAEVKRRFDLVEDSTHDACLRNLLARHLTEVNGEWVWPRGTRSALVYWDVDEARHE